jgi:hypothetical protein
MEHVSEAILPESIRCEEVWSKYGSGIWVPETGRIPFGVSINVKK